MEPKDLKNSDELKNSENREKEKKDAVQKEKSEKQPAADKKEPENKTVDKDTAEISEKTKQVPKTEGVKSTEESTTTEEQKVVENKEEKGLQPENVEEDASEKTAVEAEKQQPVEEQTAGKDVDAVKVNEELVEDTSEKTEEEEKKEVSKTKQTADEVASEETTAKEKNEKEQPATDDKKEVKPKTAEKPDYTKYNQVELVNSMREVLDNNGEHDVKNEVETIKAAFYRLVKEDIEKQKKEFQKTGGEAENFEPKENPYEKDIKDLLKRYRQIRIEFNKKLDAEKEKNLELKYQIIEEIKGLINKEESINKTFNDFRDLQQKWREIGLVPQSKMKDLWENYHFQVENFYDYIKINKELRDLDLKKNMEIKIRLCEQAEELLLEPNIVRAFKDLQKLHDRYRETGPVPREHKDDLWERFKAATTKINIKYQEYFENRKSEQKKNLEQKRALCEQVEQINELELSTHKEWNEKSKEVISIQKIWRTIGFAPRKDNNKIYSRFRKACDTFFDAKREFYSKNKELQQNNLQVKIDLCVQAEALKDSTDWRKTTQDFINIQKKWKETGPVPRKQSETLWKRFRAACDYFFDQKSEHFNNIDSEQSDNLKKKEQLIKDIEEFKPAEEAAKNLKSLKDFQRRWTEIGHVPIKKKDAIQKKFREAINKLYDDLNIDDQKRDMLKFRTKITSFSETSRGQNKMRFEREKYMSKLKQLENDLVLLDNNIGFFTKSKNAESMIEDVNKKIEATKQKIETLKDKIRVIDEMDQSEE